MKEESSRALSTHPVGGWWSRAALEVRSVGCRNDGTIFFVGSARGRDSASSVVLIAATVFATPAAARAAAAAAAPLARLLLIGGETLNVCAAGKKYILKKNELTYFWCSK